MSDTFDFEEEPKKQTGLFVAAGGLGLLLIVLNVWPDGESDKSPTETAVTAGPAAPAAEPVPTHSTRKIEWPELLFSDVIRRNPFQLNKDLAEALDTVDNTDKNTDENTAETTPKEPDPPVVQQLDVPSYPVKFIFQGPNGASAMIRDTIYQEGDAIDGMLIVRITESGVTLRPLPVDSPSG